MGTLKKYWASSVSILGVILFISILSSVTVPVQAGQLRASATPKNMQLPPCPQSSATATRTGVPTFVPPNAGGSTNGKAHPTQTATATPCTPQPQKSSGVSANATIAPTFMPPFCDITGNPTCTPTPAVSATPVTPTPTDTPTATLTPSDTPTLGVTQIADNPSSTPVPPTNTATPTITLTPTITTTPENPIGAWYVPCTQPFVNARTFPTSAGQLVRTFPAGTVLLGYEERRDSNNDKWLRVTEYSAGALWIDETQTGLQQGGAPSGSCTAATPIPPTMITPYPTATLASNLAVVPPGCAAGNDCPLVGTNPTDEQILAFVLACEGGNNPAPDGNLDRAFAIAYLIRNRTKSGEFAGTVADVVKQNGQWQCYLEGATPTAGLTDLNSISPLVKDLAHRLMIGADLPPSPLDGVPKYGLFVWGAGPYNAKNPDVAVKPQTVIANLSTLTPGFPGPCNLPVTTLTNIYIGHTLFHTASHTLVFFSDDPRCTLRTP